MDDQLIFEAYQKSNTWWHGSKSDFNRFDEQYMYTDEALAQSGPGFYLSNSREFSERYAESNGYLYEIKPSNLSKIKNGDSPKVFAESTLDWLIRSHPEYKEYIKNGKNFDFYPTFLSNWSENPNEAKKELLFSIMASSSTLLKQIQTIFADMYHNHEIELCRLLSNYKDINGLYKKIEDNDDKNLYFLIVYNPNSLKIINKIKI